MVSVGQEFRKGLAGCIFSEVSYWCWNSVWWGAAPAGSVQASLSVSPSVVLGLSIGTSLGFLIDGSLQVVRLFNMVTEDFKGEIIQTAR